MQTTSYRLPLSDQAELLVWFVTDHGAVISYSVVLVARRQDAWRLDRGVLTVVPITSNVQRVYPFQVPCPRASLV